MFIFIWLKVQFPSQSQIIRQIEIGAETRDVSTNEASIWFPLLGHNIAICPIKRDEMVMVMSQLSASIKLIGAVGLCE